MQAQPIINNRYQLLHRLGQGGMGAVYLARDLAFQQRYVALKENAERSPAAQAQFRLEAEMLARLRHPHLPAVTDHFTLPDGRQFLVMDYVPGENLEERVARTGPLPERELQVWAAQLLDALGYLHAQQPSVIHRDVKPANIRLTPEGRAVLVDFGVVKLLTGQATATVARAGSPGFAPIEQYAGGTDARSDIYALGATLYFAATAHTPLEAPLRACGQTLTPPRRINPALSTRMETAITRAMALEAARRFQSVAEMQRALQGGKEPRAPRPIGGERSWWPSWASLGRKRRQVLTGLALLATLTVLIVCSIIGWNIADMGWGDSRATATPTMLVPTPSPTATGVTSTATPEAADMGWGDSRATATPTMLAPTPSPTATGVTSTATPEATDAAPTDSRATSTPRPTITPTYTPPATRPANTPTPSPSQTLTPSSPATEAPTPTSGGDPPSSATCDEDSRPDCCGQEPICENDSWKCP